MVAIRDGRSGFGEGDADDGDEDDYNNEDDDGDAQLPATDFRLKSTIYSSVINSSVFII